MSCVCILKLEMLFDCMFDLVFNFFVLLVWFDVELV